jgi:hypothetical protein
VWATYHLWAASGGRLCDSVDRQRGTLTSAPDCMETCKPGHTGAHSEMQQPQRPQRSGRAAAATSTSHSRRSTASHTFQPEACRAAPPPAGHGGSPAARRWAWWLAGGAARRGTRVEASARRRRGRELASLAAATSLQGGHHQRRIQAAVCAPVHSRGRFKLARPSVLLSTGNSLASLSRAPARRSGCRPP